MKHRPNDIHTAHGTARQRRQQEALEQQENMEGRPDTFVNYQNPHGYPPTGPLQPGNIKTGYEENDPDCGHPIKSNWKPNL